MPPPFPGTGGFFRHNPLGIGMEGAYLIVIAAVCLFVYFKTRESYELTKHPGIRFFRNAFLFFSLASFFRFLFVLIHLYAIPFDIFLPREVMRAGLWLNAYASSMAIMSLAFSTLWKRFPEKAPMALIMNLVALSIMAATYLTRSPQLLFLTQLALILFAVLAIPNKTKSKVYITYILFLAAWGLNFLLIVFPRFSLSGRGIIYAAQIAIFSFILYKMHKATHHEQEKGQAGSHL